MRRRIKPTASSPEDGPIDRLWRILLNAAYRTLRVYWFVFRPRTRGVYVALWLDGRILTVRHSYKRRAALPGGRLERNEPESACGLRELAEEVGVVLPEGSLGRVGDFETRHEYKRDRVTVFEAELETEPALSPDRREVVWAGFETPAEVLAQEVNPIVRAYLEARRR